MRRKKEAAYYLEKIGQLEERCNSRLQLSANENCMSQTAQKYLQTPLSNRYYFGAGKQGVTSKKALSALDMSELTELIERAMNAAESMLDAKIVSFDLLSGLHGLISTLLTITEPNDAVMTLDNRFGGHFMTSTVCARIGRRQYHTVHDSITGEIDIKETARTIAQHSINVLYLDLMSVLAEIPLRELRSALGKDVTIVYDVSHPLGLIIGGAFQSPLKEKADIIVGNTHKTFPGPQKALIAFRDYNRGKETIRKMQTGLYSSVHAHHMIALAITMLEMEQYGKAYAHAVVENANALGRSLSSKGIKVQLNQHDSYTHTHQLNIILQTREQIKEIPYRFASSNINFTMLNPPGGIPYLRFGVQELTRRGAQPKDMQEVATLLYESMQGKKNASAVIDFVKQFPDIHYSFDGSTK